MGKKNAITHFVSGQKNEKRVMLKKRNDVMRSFRSAQLYLSEGSDGSEGLPEGSEGMPGGLREDRGTGIWTYKWTDRISSHSTGLRSIPGLLPTSYSCKLQNTYKGQEYC